MEKIGNSNGTINTFLLGAYLLLTILYSILGVDVLSPLGIILWGILSLFIVLCIPQLRLGKDIMFVLLFLVYGIFHLFMARTSPITMLMIFTNLVLYLSLIQVPIHHRSIANLIVLLFTINLLFNIGKVPSGIAGTEVDAYFHGFFKNPNTNGLFAAIGMAAAFMFSNDKRVRLAVLFMLVLYVISCKSRNLLLFCFSTPLFYYLLKSKFSRLAGLAFLFLMVGAMVYMIMIEPLLQVSGYEIFGKKFESAGRNEQILLVINHYDLSLFGEGVQVPNTYSKEMTTYVIHNMYINSLYAMGVLYMLFYVYFIWRKLYCKLDSNLSKAFILSFHIYFMFEPGLAFYTGIFSIPLILFMLKLNQERYEYRALHI